MRSLGAWLVPRTLVFSPLRLESDTTNEKKNNNSKMWNKKHFSPYLIVDDQRKGGDHTSPFVRLWGCVGPPPCQVNTGGGIDGNSLTHIWGEARNTLDEPLSCGDCNASEDLSCTFVVTTSTDHTIGTTEHTDK